MKDEIIICDCSSAEHQMVLRFDEEDKMVYVEIHLVNKRWYERLWMGIKYILGYKCCYGNFEEMVLTQKHARQVYNLYRFLRPKLTKEELAKLANCNGQAVEFGLKERCQDDLYEH
jgi:hypothetical protein